MKFCWTELRHCRSFSIVRTSNVRLVTFALPSLHGLLVTALRQTASGCSPRASKMRDCLPCRPWTQPSSTL